MEINKLLKVIDKHLGTDNYDRFQNMMMGPAYRFGEDIRKEMDK